MNHDASSQIDTTADVADLARVRERAALRFELAIKSCGLAYVHLARVIAALETRLGTTDLGRFLETATILHLNQAGLTAASAPSAPGFPIPVNFLNNINGSASRRRRPMSARPSVV